MRDYGEPKLRCRKSIQLQYTAPLDRKKLYAYRRPPNAILESGRELITESDTPFRGGDDTAMDSLVAHLSAPDSNG